MSKLNYETVVMSVLGHVVDGTVKVKTKQDIQCGEHYPKWQVFDVHPEIAVEWVYHGLAILWSPEIEVEKKRKVKAKPE